VEFKFKVRHVAVSNANRCDNYVRERYSLTECIGSVTSDESKAVSASTQPNDITELSWTCEDNTGPV